MFKKGSKLYSILTGACPRCHMESMYVDKNLFHLAKVYKMHDKCSHCGLHYKIEPSFFYGAMYVSYGLGVAFSIVAFVVSFVIFNSDIETALIAIVATLVGMMPIQMRTSRNIWINIFISYRKDWRNLKP